MTAVPLEVLVAVFDREDAAENTLEVLREAQKSRLIEIRAAAVLKRDDQGDIHIREVGEMRPGRGALLGGAIGAVLGLFGGRRGILAGAGLGAAAGALASRLRDAGFSDERLRELAEELAPGTSALVAVIELRWVAEVRRRLEERGARIRPEAIRMDVHRELARRPAAAYGRPGARPRAEPGRPGAAEARSPGLGGPSYTAEQRRGPERGGS